MFNTGAGGKKGANKDRSVPSLDDATDGRASDNVDQTTTGQRKNTTSAARSLKQKGKLKQQALDTNEWPSLNQNKRTGEPSSRPEGQEKVRINPKATRFWYKEAKYHQCQPHFRNSVEIILVAYKTGTVKNSKIAQGEINV